MKQLKFLETKRTPRYSMRKFSVGVASVLLGVTIFGINLTDHSVKAATIESVATEKIQQTTTQEETSATEQVQQANTQKATSATEQVQQANTHKATSATEQVQQGSASNNTTANKPTEAATPSQPAGSPATDIKSLAAKSAAKLAFMNLMAASDNGTDNGTGTDNDTGTNTGSNRNAAGTTDPNNINDQPAKENQKLANEHNLTSSDNYSSNIYQGKDKKNYYKVVTIYGNDYVYHAADIQANGGQTAADTINNIDISKEDLGNSQTRWTVTFFPKIGRAHV